MKLFRKSSAGKRQTLPRSKDDETRSAEIAQETTAKKIGQTAKHKEPISIQREQAAKQNAPESAPEELEKVLNLVTDTFGLGRFSRSGQRTERQNGGTIRNPSPATYDSDNRDEDSSLLMNKSHQYTGEPQSYQKQTRNTLEDESLLDLICRARCPEKLPFSSLQGQSGNQATEFPSIPTCSQFWENVYNETYMTMASIPRQVIVPDDQSVSRLANSSSSSSITLPIGAFTKDDSSTIITEGSYSASQE